VSFGAFIPPGLTLTLEGDANDYIGKGLSGGRLVVFPPRGSTFVLGPTGRNFAAGMTGGIAYVIDDDRDFAQRCNKEMVQLLLLEEGEEADLVKDLVSRHARLTASARAAKVLLEWEHFLPRFVRVVPNDYKRVLEAQRKMRETGCRRKRRRWPPSSGSRSGTPASPLATGKKVDDARPDRSGVLDPERIVGEP
jgi:glutamate synthase (NADPH) large chain